MDLLLTGKPYLLPPVLEATRQTCQLSGELQERILRTINKCRVEKKRVISASCLNLTTSNHIKKARTAKRR